MLYSFIHRQSKLCVISVQLLSCVWLFVTPGTAAHQASLSIISSWSLLKLMSLESVMPSKHHPLSSPSPLAFSLFQLQSLFQWVTSSHQVAGVLELQLQIMCSVQSLSCVQLCDPIKRLELDMEQQTGSKLCVIVTKYRTN